MPQPEPDDPWLRGVPARLRGPLARCARGETPANVALMQLFASATSQGEVETALGCARDALAGADAGAAGRLAAALALARANARSCDLVRSVLGCVDHDLGEPVDDPVGRCAAAFDRAAAVSPEASVALYALGDPTLLRAATDEVVDTLRAWGLLGPDRAVLDLGCGIGRFLRALAPSVARAVGIDVSDAMVGAARERCAGLPNVEIRRAPGRDLAPFANESFDLVFAADTFPYLVQGGMDLAETHVREAARVLRPCGHLLILNFSYRGDPAADRADVARLAADACFTVLRDGTRDCRLWDAATFLLASLKTYDE